MGWTDLSEQEPGARRLTRPRRRRGRRWGTSSWLVLVVLLVVPVVCQEDVGREDRQLVLRPSPGEAARSPTRRLQLPGRGNEEISRLHKGPLTLHKGRLRPVASIDRMDTRADNLQYIERRRRPSQSTYFPQDNVPFSYNSKPVPEVFLADFSDGEDQEAASSDLLLDWSTRVSQATDGQQSVDLDTKYFSLPRPVTERASTTDPGLTYVAGKPGLVLRKVKGRMKTSTSSTTAFTTTSSTEQSSERQPERERPSTERGNRSSNHQLQEEEGEEMLPSYKEIIKHFKREVWVIPVLAAAASIILIMVIFEIFLISQTVKSSPSRRHLFLGQMLLAGLLASAGMSVVFTLQPTPTTCAMQRLGTGLAYSLVYSTLLVKLVFLISLNSGVYLPATYQSLLLCFAILIQVVIGVQWLVTSPPDILETVEDVVTTTADLQQEIVFSCSTGFQQQLLGLLYVVFLILVVVVLALKSRGVRENYREAMYVALVMGFSVAIWVVWVVAGLIVPTSYQDVCTACGLIATTSITFVVMFLPRGRQLSAMGREGVYAEDRTDVYGGDSGTGSTGSSGTPSPSFFPVKPGKVRDVSHQHERYQETKQRTTRERLETPPASHKHLQIFGSWRDRGHHRHHSHSHWRGRSASPVLRPATRGHRELARFSSHRELSRPEGGRGPAGGRSRRQQGELCTQCGPAGERMVRQEDNIYTSLETLSHSDRYPFRSQPSRHNPNVLFRRPNDMPPGILY